MFARSSVLFLVAIVIFVYGCVRATNVVNNPYIFESVSREDEYIALGYYYLDLKKYKEAKDAFQQAYTITDNKVYLKEIIGILILMGDVSEAKKQADRYLKTNLDDDEIRNVLIGILTSTKQYEAARFEARILVKNDRSEKNLETLSSVYFLQNDYKNSAKYLQEAYEINHNELILDKLASTYALFLNDTNKSINLYKNHIKKYGITQLIGEKLALIYVKEEKYEQAIQIYKQLYEETNKIQYLQVILEIYLKTKELNKAQKLLETNHSLTYSDERFLEILLDIYNIKKDYKNSIRILNDLYDMSGNSGYLALEAVYIYESANDKKDKKILNEVSTKLEKALQDFNEALYLNYLGYLLIDNDMDINKGIKYVEKALLIEPSNVYYLDSLAWGYYKLKDCKKAKEIMSTIPQEEINKEEEILEHNKKIQTCK
ncbi:tetratricopeptide repeat protein [Helicobacter sp. WB40]|uniref:tetratricopeptide repeat protein n=1 Tax=Helicobacter sp. WB40 TaxID=3004130 RepID=UPI0022EBF304|nr:hypothetical protein [Helicobacter sp. WB40]MDA3967240.1 hypothetical protein [Helicobacter sp. WB40]